MKSLIFQRNLYIGLWVIYWAQGFFYETGSRLSVTVLLIVMIMSVYYWFKVANRTRLSSTIKCMNIFLLYLSIYGVMYIIMGTDYKVAGVVPISSTQYLKSLYTSFLPIYAFYFFAKEGIITQKTLQTLSIVLLVLATCQYVYNYQQRVMQLALLGSNKEEITNNVSYLFVSLIPLITFWRERKFVSYSKKHWDRSISETIFINEK